MAKRLSFFSYLMRHVPIIYLLIFPLTIWGVSPSSSPLPENKILLVSIPKCGTFLMNKCICNLMKYQRPGRLKEPSLLHNDYMIPDLTSIKDSMDQEKFFIFTHLIYDQTKVDWIFEEHPSIRIFFLYRDPRDQIISTYFFMRKESIHPLRAFWGWANELTIEEFIFKMIEDGTLMEECSEAYHGIKELYDSYTPWFDRPKICIIRFEEMIGPQGGGTIEQQRETINKIIDYLNVSLTEDERESFTNSLFGVDPESKRYTTFREGKIGSWKHYFTEEHKAAFKKVTGDLLIQLGYEYDSNW